MTTNKIYPTTIIEPNVRDTILFDCKMFKEIPQSINDNETSAVILMVNHDSFNIIDTNYFISNIFMIFCIV